MKVTDNAKSIHVRATIEFYINNQLISSRRFNSKAHRLELIETWRMTYPPRKSQTRTFIIKPDWDKYNGK